MGTPKIKIYRLDENYNEINDNDISNMSQDQLLPISIKNLNPLNAEQMVGVRERGDSRLVVQSNWKIKYLSLDTNKYFNDNNKIETIKMFAQGLVLGKGNFRVFLKRQLKTQVSNDLLSSSSSSSSSSDSSNELNYSDLQQNELFKICTQENNWYEIDRKFWDYEISTSKKYFDGEQYLDINELNESNTGNLQSFHLIDEIVFKIGNLILNSNVLFKNEYSYGNCVPLIGNDSAQNGIFIMYKTFEQLNSGNCGFTEQSMHSSGDIHQINGSTTNIQRNIKSQYSKYRVPFGNIYNGNKHGRCLHSKNNVSQGSNTNIVIDKFIDSYIPDNYIIDNSVMNFYQGNYIFKRKIMPLKYLVAQVADYENYSDFKSNATITTNMQIKFLSNRNWILDGLMKPVLMQKILKEDGKFIFKKLQENKQYNVLIDNQNNTFTCTLETNFYLFNKNYYIPKELFLFYNQFDDSLGDIFDFNYNYNQFFKQEDNINKSIINPYESTKLGAYGYANRGNILSNEKYLRLLETNGKIYKKSQILAVKYNYGYDEKKDLLLEEGTDKKSISFAISKSKYNVANDLGYRIYFNGIKVFDNINTLSVSSSSSVQSDQILDDNFEIAYAESSDKIIFTISKSNDEVLFPNDLMLVYYEQHDIGFEQKNDKNPYCLGYRIPCYQKVKNTNFFVSSFPNWVKGHLNNDLDVFVGNKKYSGVTITQSQVDAIYPAYQDDGWFPTYQHGTVQFSDNIIQFDYFDLFNFGTSQISGDIQYSKDFNAIADISTIPTYLNSDLRIKYSIYYNKVKYNVAHYDGIYLVSRGKLSNYSIQNGGIHYALLQDDDFLNSVDKKWLIRNDQTIKMMFQYGQSNLPEINRINQSELASVLQEIQVKDGQVLKLNTNSDRINVVSFKLSGINDFYKTMLICLSPSIINTKITDVGQLNDNQVRIHARVKDDNILYFGIQHQKDCYKIGGTNSSSDYCDHTGIISIPTDITFNRNKYFEMDDNIQWYQLPSLEDYYENRSLNDVHFFEENKSLLKRFQYFNDSWEYSVYFQIFSYRYNTKTDSDGNKSIYQVEFVVYKINKQI